MVLSVIISVYLRVYSVVQAARALFVCLVFSSIFYSLPQFIFVNNLSILIEFCDLLYCVLVIWN